jgi:phosphoribosylanthranilate isomerase
MSLWVKICANTSLDDAQLAAELGADAVGFVFAPSKRRVTTEQVAAIVPHLPHEIEKIGVFVDAPFDEIAAAVEASGLTGVQLHFEAHVTLAAQLRDHFGPGLRIVRTIHFAVGEPAPLLDAVDVDANIDAILVDSRTATASGGTGQPFDWDLAAVTLFKIAKKPMIAAGGLTPENVAQAIEVLKPWGVDVASGVEAAPGRKNAAKLRAFIQNARAADDLRTGANSSS